MYQAWRSRRGQARRVARPRAQPAKATRRSGGVQRSRTRRPFARMQDTLTVPLLSLAARAWRVALAPHNVGASDHRSLLIDHNVSHRAGRARALLVAIAAACALAPRADAQTASWPDSIAL